MLTDVLVALFMCAALAMALGWRWPCDRPRDAANLCMAMAAGAALGFAPLGVGLTLLVLSCARAALSLRAPAKKDPLAETEAALEAVLNPLGCTLAQYLAAGHQELCEGELPLPPGTADAHLCIPLRCALPPRRALLAVWWVDIAKPVNAEAFRAEMRPLLEARVQLLQCAREAEARRVLGE